MTPSTPAAARPDSIVDFLDETVHDDEELLEWFNASSWWDLSIALSMAMHANVEFPDREDGSHDGSDFSLTFMVYDTLDDLPYPFDMSTLLSAALDTYDHCECVASWRALEDSVFDADGLHVRVGRREFAPWDEWSDLYAYEYPFTRPAPGTWTVAKWRRERLDPCLPSHPVAAVVLSDGEHVAGQTRLATLRRALANEPRPPRPAPDNPNRLFEVMRQARWVGYVLGSSWDT